MITIYETDKKITVPISPTAIGEGQLPQKTNDSILEISEECNSSFVNFEEPLKENRITNPSY